MGLDLALGLPVAGLSAGPTWWLIGRPASYAVIVVALYVLLAWAITRWLPTDRVGSGIGPANRVTLLRAALCVPVLGLALLVVASTAPLGPALIWWLIVVSTVAMLLDGLDGRVARRTGSASAFGARFDMELDAALIMALSVLVLRSGKVGAWVLLIGLLRYGFVAAGWVVPALTRELPERFRRKVVCVVQGVVLLVALGPIVPAPLAAAVAAAGLALLSWSFAADVAWLLRRGRAGR